MSEAPSNAHAPEDEPALDKIADELYALRPDAFAAARDEHIRQAKSAGQQPLARELGRLRKPTQSAWLVNLLWRDQRDVMQQLLELGNELSAAYGRASGPELQRLTAVRRELEAALMRRAHELAEEAGVDVSPQMEREAQETLAAALAQPEVADEVRTGRLVKPAAYAGFGTFPTGAPRPEAKETDAKEPAPPPPAKTNVVELRAVQRARERREEAERRVQEARTALEAAASARAEEAGAVEAAQQRHQDLRSKVDQLQEQLHDARDAAVAAEREAVAAERRRDQAEKAHEAAQRALERAEQSLEDPTTSG